MPQDRTGEGAGGEVPGVDRRTAPVKTGEDDTSIAGPAGLGTPGPAGGGFTGPDGADLPDGGGLAEATAEHREREGS